MSGGSGTAGSATARTCIISAFFDRTAKEVKLNSEAGDCRYCHSFPDLSIDSPY